MKHREILTYKCIIYIYIFEIYFEIEYPSNNLSPLEQILRQMNIAIIIYSHTNSCIYIYISTFERVKATRFFAIGRIIIIARINWVQRVTGDKLYITLYIYMPRE